MPTYESKAQWLTPKQVSKEYPIGYSTLAADRITNRELPFSKIGTKVLYSRDDIEAFLKAHRVAPTPKSAA